MNNQLVSLHPVNMKLDYTYQPDSIRVLIPLKNLDAEIEPVGLKIERVKPVSLEDIPVREKEQTNTVIKVSSPRGRNSWWQKEQNLLVDNSRYIKPRNEAELVSALTVNEELHLPERTINQISYDWITLLLLVALALFASVKTTWNKYITNLFQSTVNHSTAVRMFNEKNNSLLHGAFLLDLLFYIIFSVFLFQVLLFFRIELPYQHFSLYLYCLVLVTLYFIAKKSIYRFFGTLIEKKRETREYLYNADNFRRVAGLILLPMVAVIAFYPYSQENIPVYAGIVLVVLLYSLLVIRGFKILLKKQFSLFYLFLYFCTLEFLPLVLLYKILVV